MICVTFWLIEKIIKDNRFRVGIKFVKRLHSTLILACGLEERHMNCHHLKHQVKGVGLAVALIFGLVNFSTVWAKPPRDEFIRGYISALVENNLFQITIESFQVRDGAVYLKCQKLSEGQQNRISKIILNIEGVQGVEVLTKGVPSINKSEQKEQVKLKREPELPTFLLNDKLFQPLIADPRWPHFSATYQRYVNDDQLKNVAATSFGESFSIYRFNGPWDSTMEFGIHAGVFAVFDLDTQSFDLINADYLVGIPLTIKKGNFSNMTRLFHQSSHLGDEFLLRGQTKERINLSYESLNSVFSYNLPIGLRVYAGGGYLMRRDPSDLKPWSTQAGLEFRSPLTWMGDALRPLAAIDVQNREESDWHTDISIRAGIQFENPDFLSRKMQILLEYYNGKSPNGQFFERNIEFYGAGIHFFF